MGHRAAYTAEYLNDGHLSIPHEIANMFSLKSGRKVRVIIEESTFVKADFLKLFGAWNQKNTDDIELFKDIYKDRKKFGRGEIEL
jgi:bifunctional DNA-binding transcriptional regulator/antitoxin component of YhaV-PrlF toxin-antitoxin module